MMKYEDIVFSWLGQFPKGQVPTDKRKEMLEKLLEQFKINKFPKEYFDDTIKSKIILACINPNHPNKKKLKRWIDVVYCDLIIAINKVYSENY